MLSLCSQKRKTYQQRLAALRTIGRLVAKEDEQVEWLRTIAENEGTFEHELVKAARKSCILSTLSSILSASALGDFVTPFLCSSAFQHGWFATRRNLETAEEKRSRERLSNRLSFGYGNLTNATRSRMINSNPISSIHISPVSAGDLSHGAFHDVGRLA